MAEQSILQYKILKKLGGGRMGIVYFAGDTKLNRPVAIKFLPSNILSNNSESEKFKIKTIAVASLNYPNIATIHYIEEIPDHLLFLR